MRVALRAVGTRGTAEAARGAGAGGGRAFRLMLQAAGQAAPTQVRLRLAAAWSSHSDMQAG